MKRLLVALLLVPGWASAATYYVDCNADGDAGAGTGTGAAVAWKTIAKVNGSSFSAGDSVLFNKGCTWREQLTVPSSGSAGSPITFGAYGSGAAPILDGSVLMGNGTSENITANTNLHPYPEAVGSWTLERSSINANVATPLSPAGTQTVDGAVASANNDTHNFTAYLTLSAATAYTHSIYVKAGATGWVNFSVNYFTSAWGYISGAGSYFNVSTGVVGATTWSLDGRSITAVGNGWYRIVISDTTPALTVNVSFGISPAEADNDFSFIGDNSSNYLYLWGAKTEASATVSAYQDATLYWVAAANEALAVYENNANYVRNYEKNLFPGQFWYDAPNDRTYVRTTGDNAASNYTINVCQLPARGNGLVEFNGKSYVTVDGLDIAYTNSYGIHSYSSGAGQTNRTVQNSTVRYVVDGAICFVADAEYYSNTYILNNTVHHVNMLDAFNGVYATLSEAITVQHGDGFEIGGNTVTSYYAEAIDPHTGSKNGTVHNNTVNGFLGFRTAPAIYIDGSTNIDVYNNLVYNHHLIGLPYTVAYFIQVEKDEWPVDNIRFYYNISYDNDIGMNFQVIDSGTTNISNIKVYNNVFAANTTNGLSWTASMAGNWSGTNEIKNNIFYLNGNDITDDAAADASIAGTTIANNFFKTGSTTETTGTSAVVAASPLLVSSSDFRLRAGSPAINAGVDVGLTQDFFGRPVGNPPEIGAYEYGLGGWGMWYFPPASTSTMTRYFP